MVVVVVVVVLLRLICCLVWIVILAGGESKPANLHEIMLNEKPGMNDDGEEWFSIS